MRIAYLDCFSGVSSPTFLGALLDAGVPFELFERTVTGLDVGATLQRSRVQRAGVAATKLDVIVDGEKDMPRDEFWKRGDRGQGSGARGQNERPGSHDNQHQHHIEHGHVHGRRLRDILKIIAAVAISERAHQLANEMFLALATAEARVHSVGIEDIHFHEVGAADAIVDIVCAAVGAEALAVDEFVCSPLNVGGGTVVCAHGTFPVPAPATVELLKGAPVYSSGVQAELVTPTGAAIAATLATRFSAFPEMKIETTGY